MTRSVRIPEFDDIADAHRFIETGEQIGKIVATV
jgi:hypothetical protein